MQIAICDDESFYCREISNLIKKYEQTKPNLSFKLCSFSSGKELLNYIDENGCFDLYILDIVMPKTNGIQLASSLRDREDTGMVVYLTSSPDFAVDSYKVKAFNYLLKPIDTEQFFSVMDEATARFIHTRREVVSIQTSDSVRIIPVNDIQYAERIGKQIHYHLINNTVINSVTFNASFRDAVSELLKHKGMLLVGSSFMVNLFHVTEVKKTDLIIDDNYTIPVPRRMFETVKAEWAKYWLNGGRYHVI